MSDEKRFQVLRSSLTKYVLAAGCPSSVPWSLLAPFEAQAMHNHDQSLAKLNSRGGLSPAEMVAVIEGRNGQWISENPDEKVVPLLVEHIRKHAGLSPLALTDEERRAIIALQRVAEKWPKTLLLFSWSGSLGVYKPGDGRTFKEACVDRISGIPNDGGDPSQNDECAR